MFSLALTMVFPRTPRSRTKVKPPTACQIAQGRHLLQTRLCTQWCDVYLGKDQAPTASAGNCDAQGGGPGRVAASFGAHFTQMYNFSVVSIRVKWTPKPALVKCRPPIVDRLPLLFRGIRRASTSISSSHPPSSSTLLMHLTSQATVDLYHAALSLLLRLLRLRPRTSVPSFPGRSTCFTSNLDDWLTSRRRTDLGTDDDAMMTSTIA